MISLDAATKSLELKLAGAVATTELPYVASYVDINGTTFGLSGASAVDGTTSGGTAVGISGSAVPATTTRKLNFLSVVNLDTAGVTLSVQVNNNGTARIVFKVVLAVGDQLAFTDAGGWVIFDANGNQKTIGAPAAAGTLTGTALAANVVTSSLTTLGVVTSPGIFSAAHHAFGVGAVSNNIGLRLPLVFTSDGGSNHFLAGIDLDPTLTATAGATDYQTYLNVAGNGITTQATETVALVAAVRITDPQITKGAGGTITTAATFYIAAAPTEGVSNYAAYVAAGDVRLASKLILGGSSDDTYFIESSANVLSGYAGGGLALQLIGTTYATLPAVYTYTTAAAVNVVVDSSGILGRSTSSRRYKAAIHAIALKDARRVVAGLTGVTYRSRNRRDGPRRWPGLIAEEVAEVAPLLATYSRAGAPDAVAYDRISAYLIPVAQDHDQRIADLTARLRVLERGASPIHV